MTNVLSVKDLHVKINQSHILHGVSFEIPSHKVTALLGRNGVGKSTTLKTIMGFYGGTGSINFKGKEILGTDTFKIAQSGIAYIPEDREIFSSLSVKENLSLAARGKDHADAYKFVHSLFPELDTRAQQRAGSLSGGQQQMVAIARGLMAGPKVLMFDEPSLGLSPILVSQVFGIIDKIVSLGMTVLIVEQNIVRTLKIADRGYVLENGEITMTGTGKELLENPHIKKAYLGI